MSKSNDKTKDSEPSRLSIIDMDHDQAQTFLLKPKSYCTLDLPSHFDFCSLLKSVEEVLTTKQLSELRRGNPRNLEDVNHFILHNKDGKYAWRPIELIHPALYVSLVMAITEPSNWKLICDRFAVFHSIREIQCMSLPVESRSDQKDRAEMISQWWLDFEQRSIELSLDYDYVVHTDIVDCYAEVYTHSIAWALHTRSHAKGNRNDKRLIGNIIDDHIQDMRQGQTNGIPQGPVLMDFIAEMVLGYADMQLASKIDIDEYHILRYRDDYRIFVNNTRDGEVILKCLTEVMFDLGLKLNPEKTRMSGDVITSSIKDDKLNWAFRKQGDANLQKHLLIIHDHSKSYPNSGSLATALDTYYRRLTVTKKCEFPLPLIAIMTDIVYRNPRVYPIAAAILAELLGFIKTASAKRTIIEKIRRRFDNIPNTGYMQIWLQRISFLFDPQINYDEPLCNLIGQYDNDIWNNTWISSKDLLNAVDPKSIIDSEKLQRITPNVPVEEIELFTRRHY